MTEAEIRDLFPGTAELLYFNSAAQCLLPRPVAEAVADVLALQARRGITAFGELAERVESTRRGLAALVGASPDRVAFTANTTAGVALVAGGLDWREGDEIVLCDQEFPANVYPWAAQQRRGARLHWVRSRDGRVAPGDYLDAIGPRTRVVAVSHVQFGTGQRLDLEPLALACRAAGALFVVDAIQSLGVVPLDADGLGIDLLVGDGRKWLLGPAGTGFAVLSPACLECIRPNAVGAGSMRNPLDMLQYVQRIEANGSLDLEPLYAKGAPRLEAGFPNQPGLIGLGAALALAERIGHATVRERIAAAAARFVERLTAAGLVVQGAALPAERAGIVSFRVAGDAEALFRRLNAESISVSVRNGLVRVSPHVYNTLSEVDRAVDRIVALAPGS